MKTSLNGFISKHYGLGYLGDAKSKWNKQYLQFDINNEAEVVKAVGKYSNLRTVKTFCEYAPEIKKLFVTLV